MKTNNPRKIAILGGTGKEGKGLAFRWALAGHTIIIGSRSPEKAAIAADEIIKLTGEEISISGTDNISAAKDADVIVLTVPFSFHKEMLESIKNYVQGKVFIDVTVPIVPPKVTRVQMPPEGSAAQQALSILGENVKIAAAFQNISYENLLSGNNVDCDVLVTGTDKETRTEVIRLVKDTGLFGLDAGPIENSVCIEGMTSILIGINKQFNVQASGIRITGIPRE
ncbi:F420-dependent NADP reductase [Leptolinea tardivitalis]|uniref:F420-dependent NADP reductase n=2 Tax=Leptolinea tardivitalis TaxID=229920 RepID=A0A0P6XR30_9CHLR|nr:F420-dependent NADP reductase [Leptolinea tardivitalis]GAP22955.1 reduced coenzyme F420:NADP oxidoreductase [Leptolinea tardivitalis]